MEKKPIRFYVVLFLFIFLTVFSFSAATLGISDFIQNDQVISNFSGIGIASLGAIAFIMGSFVGTEIVIPPIKLGIGWRSVITFGWMVLIIILLALVARDIYPFMSPLLLAITNYHWAGWGFSQAASRYSILTKTL